MIATTLNGKSTTAFSGYEGILIGYSTGYISDFIFTPLYTDISKCLSAYNTYEMTLANYGLVKAMLKGQYGATTIDVQSIYGFDYITVAAGRYSWNSSEVRPLRCDPTYYYYNGSDPSICLERDINLL